MTGTISTTQRKACPRPMARPARIAIAGGRRLRRLADGGAAEALVVMLGVMAVGLAAAAFAPIPDHPATSTESIPHAPLAAPVPPGIGGVALR